MVKSQHRFWLPLRSNVDLSCGWRRIVIKKFAAALLTTSITASAFADPVEGIRSKVSRIVALRGGVIMLPLTAATPGDQWPATVDLYTTSNEIITGHIAWIEPAIMPIERNWTDDPRGLYLREIRPEDDSTHIPPLSVLGPHLIARTHMLIDGPLRLNGQTITPDWQDLPEPALPIELQQMERDEFADTTSQTQPNDFDVPARPTLHISVAPDRPDPTSPFEYWRWEMLAHRLEMQPPDPWGNQVQQLAAEHYASLWRIGLARLSAQSQRIAEQCCDLLTKTYIDRRQPMAAWVADPVQVSSLLSRLLDFNRSDSTVLSDAVAWLDEQLPLIFWTESDYGDEIQLAMITTQSEPLLARFFWLNDAENEETAGALALRIEPGVLTHASIARKAVPKPAIIGMAPPPESLRQVLVVEAITGSGSSNVATRRFQIVFGPRVVQAKPPGVMLPPLSPPLTLAEIQMGHQRMVREELVTLAQVRRLNGRWEVFVENRRPQYEQAGTQANNSLPDHITSFDALRGIEAMTVVLGPIDAMTADVVVPSPSGPVIWLTVPEQGFWRLVQADVPNDGTLQIHKRSLADRWYCRIVLPETWFSAAETHPALIGFIRSHGDSAQLETGPGACTPWRAQPARTAIDLTLWDDLTRATD